MVRAAVTCKSGNDCEVMVTVSVSDAPREDVSEMATVNVTGTLTAGARLLMRSGVMVVVKLTPELNVTVYESVTTPVFDTINE